jgi:hypothetical protein
VKVWIDLKKLRTIGPTYGVGYVDAMLQSGSLVGDKLYIELADYLRVKQDFSVPRPPNIATMNDCC